MSIITIYVAIFNLTLILNVACCLCGSLDTYYLWVLIDFNSKVTTNKSCILLSVSQRLVHFRNQRSDPSLSRTESEMPISPINTIPQSPNTETITQEGVEQYAKQLVEESNRRGESMNITEYVSIFLQDDFPLHLIEAQSEAQPESCRILLGAEKSESSMKIIRSKILVRPIVCLNLNVVNDSCN